VCWHDGGRTEILQEQEALKERFRTQLDQAELGRRIAVVEKKNSPQRKTKTADEGPQLVVMQLREQFEG